MAYLLCSISIANAQEMMLSQQYIPDVISKSLSNEILEDQYGFIWIAGDVLRKYNGYTSQTYWKSNDSINIGTVYDLHEDKYGQIWIGASNGLFQYDRTTDKLIPKFFNQLKNKRGENSKVYTLFEDSKSRLWIGGNDNIFIVEDLQEEKFKTIEGFEIEYPNQFDLGVQCIREDRGGRIFAGTKIGLWEITKEFEIILNTPKEFKNGIDQFQILDMEIGDADTLWIAGVGGLWVFESRNQQLSKFEIPNLSIRSIREIFIDEKKQLWFADPLRLYLRSSDGVFKKHPFSKKSNLSSLRTIYKDRFDNIWIGTTFRTLKFESAQDEMLPFYRIENDMNSDDNFFFRSMQDSSGGLWFRMMKNDLGYCASLGNEFKVVLRPPKNAFIEEIKNFCTDVDGDVWVITLTNGLYQFPKDQETYNHIALGDSIFAANPITIITDKKNDNLLWVSSKYGLCSIDRFTHEEKWFHPSSDIKGLKEDNISEIVQDESGKIWYAIIHNDKAHVIAFDPDKMKFSVQSISESDLKYKLGNIIKRVAPNILWKTTKKGLLIIDTQTNKLKFLDSTTGFPYGGVLSVEPEGNGNIWLTTSRKLCKYDGKEFTCYNPNPRIEKFIYNSSEKLRDGKILFGGINGLHIFDPKKIKKDSILPQLYLTGFEIFNKKRNLGKAYELVKEITLPYSDNAFSFEFSGLYFLNQNKVRYQHQLEGFQYDWVNTPSNERKINYTNLSPGTYTFRVIASNPDGFWTTKEEGLSIKLIILPPWYRTSIAYLFWGILLLGILYGLYRFQLDRQLSKQEALKLRELDFAKSRLYTNITHEFRTPLTVIGGMSDKIASDPKTWTKEGTNLIKNNANRLLGLINQMLDLSKLEAGSLTINKIQGDIIPYLKYLVESFHSYAEINGIKLHFLTEIDECVMDYDPKKMLNIVSNLISNAIKYNNENGDIYLQLTKEETRKDSRFVFKVKDTGIGIASEYLPNIFNRFYQVDDSNTRQGEGTGIGLTLTKELINLLNGSINVQSEIGKGSTFTISLPISNEAEFMEYIEVIKNNHQALPLKKEKNNNEVTNLSFVEETTLPLLLIIEDNSDVVQYLLACLNKIYQIVSVNNGKLGIEKAIELIPDIIISDVMMPEKDGFEVCATLKKEIKTSHIPIILLTAKTGMSSKIEGLETGADAYLTKPFDEKELNVRLKKMLELRQTLQQKYSSAKNIQGTLNEKLPIDDKTISLEDKFIRKLKSTIEEHITDADLDVTQLCKLIGMSRTQLHRKITALTGMSTTKFIRFIRLVKAKELLKQPEISITEVAYDSGFSNPNYFTRSFSQMFEMTPTEYRESIL